MSSLTSFSQVVEEKIQIDTTTEIIRVIYKPTEVTTYYHKKIGVFADDTSQIAIEKSYTSYGQNGLYQVYYPNGRLKIKTVFANNKINGEWTYYDPNGIIIIKGIYEDGVKEGYWAYKSLRIYGRYRKGLKNKKWKRFDENEKKYLSHYKKGVLTGGEGFGNETPVILYKEKETIKKEVIVKDSIVPVQDNGTPLISNEYQQVISFLTTNDLLRRTVKEYFGASIKKQFKKDKFLFAIAPRTVNLPIASFIKESEEGKIVVATIDTILKNKSESLTTFFNGSTSSENSSLHNYSTDGVSPVWVFFSEINQNLLRIDVVKYDEILEGNGSLINHAKATKQQKFQILLYFNDAGILKGAEYQKP